MARRLRAAFIVVVIGGLLAGCGGGGNGGGTPGPDDLPPELAAVPDPCTFVTTEEATAALGKQTNACELLGQEDFYATARFLSTDQGASVRVDVASGGRAEYDRVKQEAAGRKEFAEVSGVGDAAFFMRPYVSADLTFLRGPYVVFITIGFVTGPPTQAVAVTLAQQAAARIAV